MIPYFFAIILLGLAAILLSPILFLPNVALPAFVASAITTAGDAIASVYVIFPLFSVAILGAYTAKVAIENWHLIFKMIMWVKELVW
jgi:hypothetical protein